MATYQGKYPQDRILHRCAYRKGEDSLDEGSPAVFWKSKKSVLILGKNTLIVTIYGLNASFEMQF